MIACACVGLMCGAIPACGVLALGITESICWTRQEGVASCSLATETVVVSGLPIGVVWLSESMEMLSLFMGTDFFGLAVV